MLLRHTPEEIKTREALTINPAKTCQPIGAMYAALGINRCLPHSHGSQGCCAYHRSALSRHYKEPVMATTSSFTEGASVFGGQSNLVQAINNIFTIYDPDIIAVHTTCLSETIGDDIPQIVSKAADDGKIPADKTVIYASTPSYVGSHVTGFSNMVKGMLEQLSNQTGFKTEVVNILPGYVEPSDMAEIRRLLDLMEVPYIMVPDTSGVLNGPQTGQFAMYPSGGTRREDLVRTADSQHTFALGKVSEPGARILDTKFKIPCSTLDLPIGIKATDAFINAVHRVAGVNVPDSINFERGQLLDVITDMNQYLFEKKVALCGDPDHLIALVQFLTDLRMKVRHVVTGTPGKKFEKRVREIAGEDINVKQLGDLFLLHQWIKNEPVDLVMGNSYVKYIARDEDIPFVRIGFPIYDRTGHQYFPIVGYRGGLRIVERILDALLDRKDRDSPEESFELVL